MKFKCHVITIMLLVSFWTPFGDAQDEQWLQYRHSREAQEVLREYGVQSLEPEKSRPEDVNLPELQDKEPVFVTCSTPMSVGPLEQ